MLATLEVVTERVAEESARCLRAPLAHIGHGEHSDVIVAKESFPAGPGDRALNPDTAVRFRGAKVIFRSEPETVDADGETILSVIQDC